MLNLPLLLLQHHFFLPTSLLLVHIVFLWRMLFGGLQQRRTGHTYYCLGWHSPDANIYLNPFAEELHSTNPLGIN